MVLCGSMKVMQELVAVHGREVWAKVRVVAILDFFVRRQHHGLVADADPVLFVDVELYSR